MRKKPFFFNPHPPLLTETKSLPVSTNVDMRYYSNLLDLVPPEACSVALIMHCMLEQVCLCSSDVLFGCSLLVNKVNMMGLYSPALFLLTLLV